MKTVLLRKIGRCVLWLLPIVIVVSVQLASMPWLNQQDESLARALNIAAAIFVMGYSAFIARRVERRLDEVQIAGQMFAVRHGWTWGTMATALLLMLPPIRNWLIDLANMMSTGSRDISDRDAMLLALFFSFLLVVLTQLLALIVVSAIWQRRTGGMAERS